MADLSTLDETQPLNGQPVSEGAARIRETRAATKGSVQVEHDLTGPHKFLTGALGAEPAAGIPGRIFLNTVLGFLERDTGAAWNVLHAISTNFISTAADFNLNNPAAFFTVQSLPITCAADGRLLAYGIFQGPADVGNHQYKMQLDGVDLVPGTYTLVNNTNPTPVFMPLSILAIAVGMAAGPHTVSLLVKSSVNTIVNHRAIISIVH